MLTPTEVASAEAGKDPEQFGFDVSFSKSAQNKYYQIIKLYY